MNALANVYFKCLVFWGRAQGIYSGIGPGKSSILKTNLLFCFQSF